MQPLAGVTVIALEHAVAAPLCTRQLADLGARVIKIEPPGRGDFARHYDSAVNGESSYFTWINRGKESVALDLKSAPGRAAVLRLLDQADVLVQNLGPGAIGRLGLGHATVRAGRPRLIAADIVGWGTAWPDRKAYDLLVQAETGLAQLAGGERPIRVGISVADIAAGMYTAQAVLAALVRRGVTGVGAHCTISLFEALAEWLSQPALVALGTGQVPAPAGMAHATIAPYGAFPLGDGSELIIAVQNDAEWQALCRQVLQRPSLADDARLQTNVGRVRHRLEVDSAVSTWTRSMTRNEARDALDAARIATAQIRGVDELRQHPLLVDRWVDIPVGTGVAPALMPPVRFDDTAPPMGPVPALGADTERVLAEFGITADSTEGDSTDPHSTEIPEPDTPTA